MVLKSNLHGFDIAMTYKRPSATCQTAICPLQKVRSVQRAHHEMSACPGCADDLLHNGPTQNPDFHPPQRPCTLQEPWQSPPAQPACVYAHHMTLFLRMPGCYHVEAKPRASAAVQLPSLQTPATPAVLLAHSMAAKPLGAQSGSGRRADARAGALAELVLYVALRRLRSGGAGQRQP